MLGGSLTIIDEYTRECLAINVAGSIRSARVIEVLSRLVNEHGAPQIIRSDSGPEFVSRAVLQWITDASIDTANIEPGKSWQNGTDERFNGKLRDECLSMEWFRSRADCRAIIEAWCRHCNAVLPHSSPGYHTEQVQGHPGQQPPTRGRILGISSPIKAGRSPSCGTRPAKDMHAKIGQHSDQHGGKGYWRDSVSVK